MKFDLFVLRHLPYTRFGLPNTSRCSFATHLRCAVTPRDRRFALMFPKSLVAALIFRATAARLQVHKRDAVATLGDQGWRIGLEECDDDLIGRIFVTDEAEWPITMNKPIPGLQLGDAALVFIIDTCTLVVAFPAFVSPFNPTALPRL